LVVARVALLLDTQTTLAVVQQLQTLVAVVVAHLILTALAEPVVLVVLVL
jgi:hypothetical protein